MTILGFHLCNTEDVYDMSFQTYRGKQVRYEVDTHRVCTECGKMEKFVYGYDCWWEELSSIRAKVLIVDLIVMNGKYYLKDYNSSVDKSTIKPRSPAYAPILQQPQH